MGRNIIMPKEQSKLEEILKINFKNKDFLREALVHRSYINEHPGFELGHNERMEFLGDAVLELVVTEYLYNNYPNPEGELTNWRAALVNAQMLSSLAYDLGFYEYMYLSRGEASDKNPKAKNYILANAFEAIVGAIYLDQGWEIVKTFLMQNLLVKLPYILEHKLYLDPKSNFQELAQEKVGVTPGYKVLEESGPDHNKRFVVGVFLADKLVASGEGTSKQEAQMQAAANALEKHDREKIF